MNEHKCPGGCGAMVPRARLACPVDWYRLPAPLRAAVNESWRHRHTDNGAAHRAALADALEWYRENPRAAVSS